MSVPERVKNKMKELGLEGVNKPKRTPKHPTKSHVVMAKEGDKYKLVRFGQQNVKGEGNSPSGDKGRKRRASFRARHKCDQKKSKLSAQYWACKVKW